MRSPFDELGNPPVVDWEEVEGAFSCQEIGCPSTVYEARYIEKINTLTWKCDNEHINKIEGFE